MASQHSTHIFRGCIFIPPKCVSRESTDTNTTLVVGPPFLTPARECCRSYSSESESPRAIPPYPGSAMSCISISSGPSVVNTSHR
jgi:hypothetical protein